MQSGIARSACELERTTDARNPSLALTAAASNARARIYSTSRTLRVFLLPNDMPHPAPCTQ